MKNLIIRSKVVFFVFLYANSCLFSQTMLHDSLVNIKNVYVYCLTDPQKAQLIIDVMREHSDLRLVRDYELDWAQGDLFFNTGKYRQASYYFEKVADYDTIKNNSDFKMGLLSTMMECYLMNNQLEKSMMSAIDLLKIAESKKNNMEMGRAYFMMGKIFYSQKKIKETFKYFDLAEEHLEKGADVSYLFYFYLSTANVLQDIKEYAESLEKVNQAENVLTEMFMLANMPVGYGEYEQGRLYALKADILAKNGKRKEAEAYYEKFVRLPFSFNISNKIHIAPYLISAHRYQEAIEISKQREEFIRSNTDTIGTDMLAAKHYLAKCFEKLGMHDIANSYLKEINTITDSLRVRDLFSASQELAVIYETQKKDEAIIANKLQIRLQKTILITGCIIIVLSVLGLILVLRNHKKTKLRNKIMVKQIKELQEYKLGKRTEKRKETEKMLYDKLQKLMMDDKIYHNTTLTRDEVAEKLNVSKSTLLQLLHSNDLSSFTEYINSFRLEESIYLMEQMTNESIESIASKVGFGSVRTFQRQFKDKFGMSPAEYRKAISTYDENGYNDFSY